MDSHGGPVAEAYLDLLKGCLTRSLFGEDHAPLVLPQGTWQRAVLQPVRRVLATQHLELVRRTPFDADARAEGLDWPAQAETMVGLKRLENVQDCATDVLRQGVPGDLVETGVWRGGTTIFMRAILKAYGDIERNVWVADSFEGLPKPNAKRWPQDEGDKHWTQERLMVSQGEVRANFARYGLLDDQVRFLPGFFEDTLPTAPIEQIAILRLDGDMYGSTMEALQALYPKVSPGGYVLVDDYGALAQCRQAVTDYRTAHEIRSPIERVDWTGVWWQKSWD
jgi:O-methyltransferase